MISIEICRYEYYRKKNVHFFQSSSNSKLNCCWHRMSHDDSEVHFRFSFHQGLTSLTECFQKPWKNSSCLCGVNYSCTYLPVCWSVLKFMMYISTWINIAMSRTECKERDLGFGRYSDLKMSSRNNKYLIYFEWDTKQIVDIIKFLPLLN
jgi:hypothetical protein